MNGRRINSRRRTHTQPRRQCGLSGTARKLAIDILRAMVDAIDEQLNSHPDGRAAHPLFEAFLEVYAMWAELAHPEIPQNI